MRSALLALVAAVAGAAAATLFIGGGDSSADRRPVRDAVGSPGGTARQQVSAFGAIVSKTPDALVLRTRSESIVVEVDDASPLYREASMLRVGDQVAVIGLSDGPGRIEASRIFVDALPEPIRADPADEEGARDGGR